MRGSLRIEIFTNVKKECDTHIKGALGLLLNSLERRMDKFCIRKKCLGDTNSLILKLSGMFALSVGDFDLKLSLFQDKVHELIPASLTLYYVFVSFPHVLIITVNTCVVNVGLKTCK